VVFTSIKFFLVFFVISSSKCGVVLFVVLCGVWFRVLSRCLFSSYWKIYTSQLQIQPMIWTSMLQIRRHGYFGDLGFIILFIGILPLYAINLSVMNLFADSRFVFVTKKKKKNAITRSPPSLPGKGNFLVTAYP